MQVTAPECATMHRRPAAWVCALTLAVTAVALPSAAPTVEAATACTNWSSTYTPPTTVRVLRTYGPASGKVQVVPFRAYVENVMAWEWPETYPTQALRAGAVAVKQYAWYYARVWRGGKVASGACYDVKDTSADQIYRPETRSAGPRQAAAVAATWNLSIRRLRNGKPGRFILTGYVPGSIKACGAEKNGFRLYQKGAKACAKDGKTFEQIARVYYGSTLELTDPGRHNIAGSTRGDVGAAEPAADGVDVHVLTSNGSGFDAPPAPDAQATSDAATLGRVSADIDGDGDDELISLVNDGPTSQHIEIRQPAGYGYSQPVAGLGWDSDDAGVAFASERDGAPGIQLVAADFDADYDDDLALIVAGDEPGVGSVHLLISYKTYLRPIVQTFAGVLDAQASEAFAGDVTGDNRADIVLLTPTDDGLAARVMKTTTAAGYPLAAPATWYTRRGADPGRDEGGPPRLLARQPGRPRARDRHRHGDHLPWPALDRQGLRPDHALQHVHGLRAHQARVERREPRWARGHRRLRRAAGGGAWDPTLCLPVDRTRPRRG